MSKPLHSIKFFRVKVLSTHRREEEAERTGKKMLLGIRTLSSLQT